MKIPGKPEGREGVWLIRPDVACDVIAAVPGDEIHNFIGGGAMFIGADWDKERACELVRRDDALCAMLFPPNMTVGHQLVVTTATKRYGFDVGKIEESDMELEP